MARLSIIETKAPYHARKVSIFFYQYTFGTSNFFVALFSLHVQKGRKNLTKDSERMATKGGHEEQVLVLEESWPKRSTLHAD